MPPFKDFPKIELHLHLNGSISETTLQNLAHHCNVLGQEFNLPTGRTLSDCFVVFDAIHKVSLNPSAARRIAKEAVECAALDNVIYLELRTTSHSTNQMSAYDYLNAVVDGINSAEHRPHFVTLILALDRGKVIPDIDDWFSLLSSINNAHNNIIRGIDIAGNPTKGHTSQFAPFIRRAKDIGLKTTIHFAEIDILEDINATMELSPDRLGHAVLAGKKAIEHQIPVEVCLTSNLITESATLGNHPVIDFFQQGHLFSICTDDCGVFKTNFTDEYEKVFTLLNCDLEKFIDIVRNSIQMTFLTQKEKTELLQIFDAKISAFLNKFSKN
ncbi:hypothetical protein P9112_002334, partial [Eukaryota sp. TZLM1-RC]